MSPEFVHLPPPPRHFVLPRLKRAEPRVGSRRCFVIGAANVPNESEEAREVASEGRESVPQSDSQGAIQSRSHRLVAR